MNKSKLFEYLRKAPFGVRITQGQVDGVNVLLSAFERHKVTDVRHQAYMLATVFHETGSRMAPVRETFARSDKEAIQRLDKAWANRTLKGVSRPYWRTNYFGRGYVQLTHEFNYQNMGRLLGINLSGNPSLALDPDIAADILVVGSVQGTFVRGQNLNRYFPLKDQTEDVVGARRIINGTDKAKLIASYYRNFKDALEKAAETPHEAVPVEFKPDDVPPVESKGLLASLTAFLSGFTSLGFLSNVDSPWALSAFGLLLISVAIIGYMVYSGKITINRIKEIV